MKTYQPTPIDERILADCETALILATQAETRAAVIYDRERDTYGAAHPLAKSALGTLDKKRADIRHLEAAIIQYQEHRAAAGNDPLARARVNGTMQGWLLQWRGAHDPYIGTPVTEAMIDDMQARMPSMPPEMAHVAPIDPPVWKNPKPGPCNCLVCRGILTFKYTRQSQKFVNGKTYAEVEDKETGYIDD